MDSQEELEGSTEEDQESVGKLGDLERKPKERIPLVVRRSPETSFEKLKALELVIDLRK